MKIKSIRIKNFRTIKSEINLDLMDFNSIIGPNNSGKSNISRAIGVFFSGRVNNRYDPDRDLSHGVSREKTSITVAFSVDENDEFDQHIMERHDTLRGLHVAEIEKTNIVSLNLYFSDRKPIYQFFGNQKRPTTGPENARYSRIQNELIDEVISHFNVYYVPSAKSFDDIFNEFIFPELRDEIAPTVEAVIPNINQILDRASSSMNENLALSSYKDITASITISEEAASSLVTKIDFMIADGIKTELSRKGTGVQAAAIFGALKWIDERKRVSGKEVIWIVEEPESYLHPELMRKVYSMIKNLSAHSTVIITTHSLVFIPKTVENIIGCERTGNDTSITKYQNFYDASNKIRKSIGVRFSDYFNLGNINIAVEGKSDRSIFEDVLKYLVERGLVHGGHYAQLKEANFLTFSGVQSLGEFVGVTFEKVREECLFISVFDGDDAGVRVRKKLQHIFDNKKPKVHYRSNKEFVSVRTGYPIEGLFPDRILIAANESHPNWFSNFSVDAAGVVEPFNIKDEAKKKAQDFMTVQLLQSDDVGDFQRFIVVFDTIERAFQEGMEALSNEGIFA